jgi:hypothetical protein
VGTGFGATSASRWHCGYENSALSGLYVADGMAKTADFYVSGQNILHAAQFSVLPVKANISIENTGCQRAGWPVRAFTSRL